MGEGRRHIDLTSVAGTALDQAASWNPASIAMATRPQATGDEWPDHAILRRESEP